MTHTNLIARVWRGASWPSSADAYFKHVTESVFPALDEIPGYLEAYVLRRHIGEGTGPHERIEFLVLTLWESMAAVRAFAGDDPDVAVVEPTARAMLAEFDDFVCHYEVVYSSRHSPSGRPARSTGQRTPARSDA